MFKQVPPQFPRSGRAKLAFVGEAPSYEEVARGVPFVGPAGRLFDVILRSANIDRAEVFVGNVFDTQWPHNDAAESGMFAPLEEARLGAFTDMPPLRGAGFLRPEHREHLERLATALASVQPNVIVPLGGTALWAFTGAEDISQRRGALDVATRLMPGAKILPTFHPSFVQRQWKFLPIVVGDVSKAASEAERGPQMVWPKREIIIEPTLEDLRALKSEWLASDLLSLDIETSWGQITELSIAGNAGRGASIPFVSRAVANRSYWPTLEDEYEAWEIVREVFDSPVPKLGQNFAFYDTYWLWERYRIRVRNFRHDTRLIHHALHAELPKDLAFLGGAYTELGPWKTYRERKADKRDE